MRRSGTLIAVAVATVLAVGGAGAAPAVAAPDASVDTIVDRLQDYYLGQGDEVIIANGIYLARTSEALDYVASQNADGSWTDVNYADRTSSANGAVWSPYIALYRALALTHAYRSPGAPGFNDPAVLAAVNKALVHWDRVNPGNQNWWETEVGESIAMGRISVFLGDVLDPAALDVALKHNTGKLDPVGANGAWRTTNFLFEAVATKNVEDIARGVDTMVSTIAVDPTGAVTFDGAVQVDASYWAHGAQLYSEGYGLALFTNVAIWADAVRGTDLALNRNQLDAVAFYIISGTRWMIRGEVGMPYLGYRPAKTVDGVTGYAAEFLEPLDKMVRSDALYSTAYQQLADSIRGKTRSIGATGNKYFWRSEFSAHQRDEYAILTRLNSSRTVGSEYRSTFRPEVGNEIVWNSAGTTAIQVNNREYLDLGPAFDWFHYPGVTAPYVKEQTRGTTGNGGSFTGGVSDGRFGAAVHSLDRAATKGSKSYFYFDDEMVALGAAIRSTSDAPVHTVVNQAAAKSNATVDGSPVARGTDSVTVTDPTWAYNDEVGYVFPTDADVKVSNKTQTGSWVGEDAVERDAFTLFIDHGVKPVDAGYEYIVLPASTPAEVAAYAHDPAVDVLRNDASVQAVRHGELERTIATFYEAGELDLGQGRTLEVSRPAIVLLDESGDAPVVGVANPDVPGLVVNVSLHTDTATQTGTFGLGSGANLGKTVTAELVGSNGSNSSPYHASGSADGRAPALAGDADIGTSWASAAGGVQWLAKDLEPGSFVTGVTVNWAGEFPSKYLLQTSRDGVTWTDQRFVQDGNGGADSLKIAPTAASFVRVLLLESVGPRYEVAEFEVAASRNLALGRAVSASGGSAPGSVADADMSTRWIANLSDAAWTQVDLGSVQPIGAVRLWWEASYAKQYRIQVSDDGAAWRNAYSTPAAGSDGGVDVIDVQENARFVRMQTVQRSTTQYGVSIWEFEIFAEDAIVNAPTTPAGRENLALGKTTTADTAYNATLDARFATDGNATTRWGSARQDAPYTTERWLQVDLGESKTVNQAVLTWEAATSNDFRVQGSVDGSNWTDLARVTKTSGELKNVVDFADAHVRYVRVIGLPATKYGMSLFELELYGGYKLGCVDAPLTVPAQGTAELVVSVTPLEADDAFHAYALDAGVLNVTHTPRVGTDGRITFGIEAGGSGSTTVLVTHDAGSELVWCGVTLTAETAALQAAVERANGLDSTRYTPESWAPVLPALEAAKQTLATPGAEQAVVDAQAEALTAAVDGLRERGIDVEVTVATRCASGKTQLTVTTRNPSDVAVSLTYATAYGSKSFPSVAPGKTVFHAFTTRQAKLTGGEVTVTATATIDGRTVTSTETADYAARSCG